MFFLWGEHAVENQMIDKPKQVKYGRDKPVDVA